MSPTLLVEWARELDEHEEIARKYLASIDTRQRHCFGDPLVEEDLRECARWWLAEIAEERALLRQAIEEDILRTAWLVARCLEFMQTTFVTEVFA